MSSLFLGLGSDSIGLSLSIRVALMLLIFLTVLPLLLLSFLCSPLCISSANASPITSLLRPYLCQDLYWQQRNWKRVRSNFCSVHCPSDVCHFQRNSNYVLGGFFVPSAPRFQSSDFTSSAHTPSLRRFVSGSCSHTPAGRCQPVLLLRQ